MPNPREKAAENLAKKAPDSLLWGADPKAVVQNWKKLNRKSLDSILATESREVGKLKGGYRSFFGDGPHVRSLKGRPSATGKRHSPPWFIRKKKQWEEATRTVSVLQEYLRHSSLSEGDLDLIDGTIGNVIRQLGEGGDIVHWQSGRKQRWKGAKQLIDNLDAINKDLAGKRGR